MINLTNKTAKFSTTKITSAAIAIFLIAIMAGSLAGVPYAHAAPPIVTVYHTSYSYVAASPAPPAGIGIGQTELLVLWTADIPPDIGETQGIAPSSAYIGGPSEYRAFWFGQSFNVTDPNGVTTNFPIGGSDPVGGGYIEYTPTMVGTYTVTSIFPAVWKNSTMNPATGLPGSLETGYPNDERQYYSTSVSPAVTFTVVQNPQPAYPESPLPTGPWTAPISGAARTWSVLPGDWLAGAWNQPITQAGGTTLRYQYGTGTLTSHIEWSYPYYAGGWMDARFGEMSYETGHYQGLDFSAIIMNGLMYTPKRIDAYIEQGYYVIDLYTGQIISYQNSTFPAFGEIYNYGSPNQHGGYPLLIVTSGPTDTPPPGVTSTSSWELLDGYTLHHLCNIGNVTQTVTTPLGAVTTGATGTQVIGPIGEVLYYNLVNYGNITNPNFRILVWNDTNVLGLTATAPGTGTAYWQWRPEGGGFGGGPGYNNSNWYNGVTGFSANYSIPSVMYTPSTIFNNTASIRDVRVGQYVIIAGAGQNNELGNFPGQAWAVSDSLNLHGALLSGNDVSSLLWKSTWTLPYSTTAQNLTISMVGIYPESGVILYNAAKLQKYWAFNMTTGAAIWDTGTTQPQLNYYSMQNNYYKGMLLTTGYGGVVQAYDMVTGAIVWNYTTVNIGDESPYGNYPVNIFAICNGVIYTLAGEHSTTIPLWRGPNIRAINATNGKEIWATLGQSADNGAHLTGQYIQMGDGFVVGLNYMDGMIYCFGPGNSATTVSAPQTVGSLGSSVMITGTVTDQTNSGRINDAGNLDFTLKGTPAISDASMSAWMEYMYEQQPFPANATGVPVSLDAIDPNGNYIHIGTVTSNDAGTYGLEFTPQVPGQYQITATFAGSHAYGSSFSETYMAVGNAQATPVPTQAPVNLSPIESSLLTYVVIAAILIIIAIAIVGILMLRKHA